ncbi:MAG: hypothetical protein GEU78_17535 [Actinobacteria bacterium]|nr:hypothetical protein [Actinomycetota bacterium]
MGSLGIERRRKKLDRRRELIDRARILLDGTPFNREDYRRAAEYNAISIYLPQKRTDNVNKRNIIGGEENLRDNMFQELNKLEKKWDLI